MSVRDVFIDIIVDADWDGLMSGVILLRMSPEARMHVGTRSELPSILSRLESAGGAIALADLSVNVATWPSVKGELARLSAQRPIVWYDSHEFENGEETDPRSGYARLVLEPGQASARLVQSDVGDQSTERLAKAAEMSDQGRSSRTDRELWKQVYLARPAISAWRHDRGWMEEIVRTLASSPGTDFRQLPALEERGIRAIDETWNAVAQIYRLPTRTYETGLVGVWVNPSVPPPVGRRPGVLAGGLAMNRTAIVAVTAEDREGWMDIRARRPRFWSEVDLRVLDPDVRGAGGHGSGSPGATHWDLPVDRLDYFLSRVEALAPRLHGEPKGRVGELPPRRQPNH